MLSTLRSTARSPRIVAPYHRLRLHRAYASVTDLQQYPKPGDRLHGFTLQRAENVPELELAALHFTHDKTGADYLHIARDDTNNVFSIGFKTNPPDATGVPHILEHVTLCGSEKYPVRDPFFKMLPRSLQNFMNAMTSSSYTYYPFATTNRQDYKNLMGVYLDATLHPLLKRTDFLQEGWRVGPENPKEPVKDSKGSDLVFKGVVYNEMKGQMSDATYLFYSRFMEHIMPAINNSGGDPQKMTELTYEGLKTFHEDHYHPSNSKILTYGDQSVEEHLQFLGEQLSQFNQRAVDTDIKAPIVIDSPQSVTVKGPVDPLTPPDAQFKTSLSWIATDRTDQTESFGLQIATNLLMDGYGSPLYQNLIESGLGTDFSMNTGYMPLGRKSIFSIGLNGVSEENLPKIKDVIYQTIEESVAKGLEKQKVDGILHQLELGLKHKKAAFGMGIVSRLNPGWFNGVDPFESLQYNKLVDAFKANYAKGGYLEDLLRKYLLNDRTLTFTMEPSTTYTADIAAEEASRLQTKIKEAIESYPSEEEAHRKLRERELDLIKEQDAGHTESVDSLPSLKVSDIPRVDKEIKFKDNTVDNGVKVQWHQASTNGLTYFRAVALLKDLPEDLRMLVPLFCDSLMRIGTKTKSMGQLEDEMKLKTGGISFGHFSSTSPHDIQKVEEGFSIGGRAFDYNVPAMYELIQTILLETDFDSPNAHKMIRQLLQMGASGAVDGIAASGHMYAMRYATAGVSPAGKISEQIGGITQVKLITSLAAAEENPEAMTELINKLKAIQYLAVQSIREGNLRAALTCGTDAASSNESALNSWLGNVNKTNLSSPSITIEAPNSLSTHRNTLFNLPYQVSYSALTVPTGPYTSQSTAPIAILSQLLTHRHLHAEIREKGGAYGGGATSSGLTGTFGMYSYRDPNPDNTLSIYHSALSWAAKQTWTERDMQEAKLSVFQKLDAPTSVSQEGMTRFLNGITYDMEQQRREWLLDVTPQDVKAAAEQLGEQIEKGASVAVLGNKDGKKFLSQSGVEWKVEELGMKGQEEIEDPVMEGEGTKDGLAAVAAS
ncbi:hypothetical protein CKM354_001255200 [Cercospora kikuchii]|uniref:Presequence protease, mitochondrial n=1 Tax=Cercospora kikuchii TaxID=84275 RepID=A0A9P3FM70_9PEZI|nr:uncharacterized protein CKM354_001255200 [Cercospora kikuchii]GIZ49522.1 hypothetical protein CKM354_001255200 [Cercospora kikuchii]